MAKGKMKMLHLIRIFTQETDDEHALTLQEIAAKLAAVDIQADRKTLYSDFEELRSYGFDIIAQQRCRTTFYHLGAREFELPELKLLVDSVQAAKFITSRKSAELIRKLEKNVSHYQADQLHRQVYIAGRVKSMNESIYYNIDKLYDAINAGVQIRFQYSRWNLDRELELRRGGALYQISPWALAVDNGNYYLVAFDTGESIIKHFRVDKMQRIRLLEAPRLGQEAFRAFDMARYTKSMFGMFTGETTPVTLEAENGMVGALIDRFGRDIPLFPVDGDHFRATVEVVVSIQFFGWVVGLGPGLRVAGPDWVVERMREEVRRLAEQYR